MKRRLRPLRRSLACRLGWHDYIHEHRGDLGVCRYCYAPNFYVSEGLSHRLERWEEAVEKAEDDGAIPAVAA